MRNIIIKAFYERPRIRVLCMRNMHLLQDYSTKDADFYFDGSDFGDQDSYTDSDGISIDGSDFGSGI